MLLWNIYRKRFGSTHLVGWVKWVICIAHDKDKCHLPIGGWSQTLSIYIYIVSLTWKGFDIIVWTQSTISNMRENHIWLFHKWKQERLEWKFQNFLFFCTYSQPFIHVWIECTIEVEWKLCVISMETEKTFEWRPKYNFSIHLTRIIEK